MFSSSVARENPPACLLHAFSGSEPVSPAISTDMAPSKNPHICLDSAFALLTSTMRDPMKANVCAMRVSLAADRIDQELEACTSIAAKTKIANSHPEFLRAGIKFLTFTQPPSDHMAMINHLTRCRCDFGQAGMRNLHKPSRYRLDGRVQIDSFTLIFDAVATLSNCLILALADLTQHKFRNANASGEQNWPQEPDDLLPYGPKDSLIGLELWVAAPPLGYIIFKLAGSLALFYIPFAREVFQSPKFTFAFARPIEHLKEAIKYYDEGDSSSLARTHFLTYPVRTIFEFFDNLHHCDNPQFNVMVAARGSWISHVLSRLTTILSTLPMAWSETRSLVQFMTAYANAKIDPVTGVATVKFERELLTELPFVDGLRDAFEEMVEARKMGCLNITCSSAAEIIHSRLCSGCNLIRFCGEKCQKEAWKSAVLPHKPVCVKIHSVKESFGADDWSLLWTPDFAFAHFPALCRAKNVDIEVVKVIGTTIGALRRQKIVFQEDSERAGASQMDRLIRAEQEKVAAQNLSDLIDSVGLDSLTILNREDSLAMMSRGAIH
ncbi:hypothetical protein Hypma_012670 [Hypsizygus marmoreus]|uniref:MYND-type domain-containing protein n=1 Tax=Hypsizygus marmoreus TaxID=39966 RepID=A0A369JNK4_HYPMA|nr:hypothetical protein Hypma_012670 [Hypsizygus marmoreus]